MLASVPNRKDKDFVGFGRYTYKRLIVVSLEILDQLGRELGCVFQEVIPNRSADSPS